MDPKQEPVLWGVGVGATITEVVGFANDFGAHLTQQQTADIVKIVGLLIFFGGLIARSRVTPVEKAEKAIDAAYVAQPGDVKPTLANPNPK